MNKLFWRETTFGNDAQNIFFFSEGCPIFIVQSGIRDYREYWIYDERDSSPCDYSWYGYKLQARCESLAEAKRKAESMI